MSKRTVWTVVAGTGAAVLVPGVAYALFSGGPSQPTERPGISADGVGAPGAELAAAVERVGTVSRVVLPTDGLWRGAMHGFQDPSALVAFGGDEAVAFPFLSAAPLTPAYLVWAAVWVAMVGALAATSFLHKDL